MAVLAFIEAILNYPVFQVAQTDVTLRSLITFVIVNLLFIKAAEVVRRTLVATVLIRFKLEKGTRYALSRITQYLIVIVGMVIAFQFIGIDLSGLLVVFGFLSVGIGFGLQNITSNFISGLILLFEQHIKVGDRVSVGDTEGDVVEINIRSTTVRSLNNISIIVPNSEFISGTVVNWSHGDPKVRLDIPVGVSYDSDLDTVLRVLRKVAEDNRDVLKHPPSEVLFEAFGDSAWEMNLRVWINDPKQNRHIRSALNCAIVAQFRAHGIEIPFPQRDLHFRTPAAPPEGTGAN